MNQDNNKQDSMEKDSMGDEGGSKDAKVCPSCGGKMMAKGDKMVCEGCGHEMPM